MVLLLGVVRLECMRPDDFCVDTSFRNKNFILNNLNPLIPRSIVISKQQKVILDTWHNGADWEEGCGYGGQHCVGLPFRAVYYFQLYYVKWFELLLKEFGKKIFLFVVLSSFCLQSTPKYMANKSRVNPTICDS